jgi:hypothetical protein
MSHDIEVTPASDDPDAPAFIKSKAGRPSKLSEELVDKILVYIRSGAYIETAVVAAGASKQAFYVWAKVANDAKAAVAKDPKNARSLSKYQRAAIKFLEAVEKALAEAEMADVITIRRASARSWQAAAWHLERKSPARWGRRDHLTQEVTGKDGAAIVTENVNVAVAVEASDAEHEAILARHMERKIKQNERTNFAIPTVVNVPVADAGDGDGELSALDGVTSTEAEAES